MTLHAKVPAELLAGECAGCHRAVQECGGCSLWLDVDDSSVCRTTPTGVVLHVVAHPAGAIECCCYPEPCAGHLPPGSPWTRHPSGIPCNEPSFVGGGV